MSETKKKDPVNSKLDDAALDNVSGGSVTLSDTGITRENNTASDKLSIEDRSTNSSEKLPIEDWCVSKSDKLPIEDWLVNELPKR